MSYDYNSQDSRFDIKNPYRVENAILLAAASVLMLGGILLLLISRKSLGSGSLAAWTPLVIGVLMLMHGFAYVAKAMSRLRFFFGRGQPASLACELTPDENGHYADSDEIKSQLRHNSLAFAEPKGPLNGLLYSLIPGLIYSPTRIQALAQRQFQNALAIGVTLLSLLVSAIGSSPEANAWIGLGFFAMTVSLLIKPLETAYSESGIGMNGLLVLVLIAILGPVFVPMIVRGREVVEWLPSGGQAAAVLLCFGAGIAVFFLAVLKQCVKAPPAANMAMEQGAISMNSHPKQVVDELERRMQEGWVSSLPNRRYAREQPVIEGAAGSFSAELLEETQPILQSSIGDLTPQNCLQDPHYRWLGALGIFAITMLSLAVILTSIFAVKFYGEEGVNYEAVKYATMGLSLWALGRFCLRAGETLWGRFDFASKLIWVELHGNFQAAQMDFGNVLSDRVKTQKQVISIDNMTLRVWVAEINTVAFGKDSRRTVLAMRGLKDEAGSLFKHLATFAGEQSMVVAPTSNRDVERVSALGVLNKAAGSVDAPPTLPNRNEMALPGLLTVTEGADGT